MRNVIYKKVINRTQQLVLAKERNCLILWSLSKLEEPTPLRYWLPEFIDDAIEQSVAYVEELRKTNKKEATKEKK